MDVGHQTLLGRREKHLRIYQTSKNPHTVRKKDLTGTMKYQTKHFQSKLVLLLDRTGA